MSNLVKAGTPLKSFAGLDSNDIKPTRVNIGQKNSEKGDKGSFVFNTGESYKELLGVIPLFVIKTRIFYKEGSKVPLCASDNFTQPAGRIDNPICKHCANCPAAYWGDDLDAKREISSRLNLKFEKKPLCKEQYNIYMLTSEMIPFILNVHGSSIQVLQKVLFPRYQMAGLELYQASVDLKTEVKTSGTFSYYALSVSNFKPLENFEVPEKLFNMYFKSGEKILEDQFTEEMETNKAADPGPAGIDEDEKIPF